MFKHSLSSGNVATKMLAGFTTISDVAATVILDENCPEVESSVTEPSNVIGIEYDSTFDSDCAMNQKAIIVAPPRTEKTLLQVILHSIHLYPLVCTVFFC